MKKITILFATMIMIAISANVMAQNTATSNPATASALIVKAIDISKTRDLLFGTIAVGNQAGKIIIDHTEDLAIDYTVDAMEMPSTTERSAAKFSIVGEEDANFSVGLESTITLNGPDSETMPIATSMNLLPSGNTLLGGAVTLYVGGELSVIANQTPGSYTNTFTVTVSYE